MAAAFLVHAPAQVIEFAVEDDAYLRIYFNRDSAATLSQFSLFKVRTSGGASR